MKSLCTFLFLLLTSQARTQFLQPPTPDKIYGDLFTEVQMKKVFPDEKTFNDCIRLDRCGQKNLASLAAKRWIKLNY